jgi:50S ribosomal subunit-associated GTPase HflX
VLVGFFSARRKDFAALMDAAADELAAHGGQIVGRVVQRRGVSKGGVRRMESPYSSRTVLSSGKVREAADLCERTAADAVVFLTPLTAHQRRVLTEAFGRPVANLADALPAPSSDEGSGVPLRSA